MGQKSLNENIKAREQSKGDMTSNIDDIDDLLDDEGWDILNSLTEDELAQLNSDFDPENMLIPTGERVNHQRIIPGTKMIEQKEVKPMFSQKDLKATLDAKVANSQPVIKNDKIRQKEEDRKKQKEAELNRKHKGTEPEPQVDNKVMLTEEEEELLADATEEELIEAAALLNMNDILTSEQINAVFAGDKPAGGMSSGVKGTLPKRARITKQDEETDLDVVRLNKHLKEDTDDLFYLCVNNQPKLEKQTLELIISAVANSKKIKHLSLSMIGLADKQCIQLCEAISKNEQLETLNLDSNIIGMPGIEALMNVVSEHPTLRELKISNQKQPFGGQGEECMASAVVKNQNILRFGYSFKQAAPRNKVDRAIIRNNEFMRQKRRNGEEAYDLKSVCKLRDPWPQPWIRVKGQRLLGSQLENKVTDMGLMIDPEADVGGESRGPKVGEEGEAKPLDIAALLAARANKLKGTKVAELDKEAEERRKKTLLAMKQSEEESGRVGTMLKKGPATGDAEEQAKPKESLKLGNNEAAPPVEAEKKTKVEEKKKVVEKTKVEEKKKETPEPKQNGFKKGGVKISSLEGDSPVRRKKKPGDREPEEELKSKKEESDEEEEEEDTPTPEPEKPKPEDKKKKLSVDGASKVVARFDQEEVAPRRRRKKIDEEEEIDPFKGLETKKKEEEKEKKEADERKKKEEEERKAKEEEEKREREEKERKEKEDEEKAKKEKEAEEAKAKKEDPKKKLSDLSAAKKIASLAPVADAAPVRRRKPRAALDEDPEPAFLSDVPTEEPKKEVETEKPLSAAEQRAKALKERREALEAKKKGPSKPDEKTETSDKPQSAADRAKALKEKREALEAKKTSGTAQPTSDTNLSAAEERARSLKERREKLAERKSALDKKPTTEATTPDKPKIDIASSLASEDKPLSLKERRALLAEKKRLMGK